ncbi:MAG: NAD-dependent epimerase/dehydratase family protein [Cyanobacteria bacterium P01_F01_bin.86]
MGVHLVTGGNGFLGTFISRKLLDMGEEVRIVDVVDDSLRDQRASFHNIDILDRDALKEVMQGVDYVHHNAALVPLKKAGDRFQKVNVDGTDVVLQVAKECGVKHFSHMSSSAVFGNVTKDDCPIKEDPPHLEPIEIYGKSKKDGEDIVKREIAANGSMTCSIIRPRTIIGTERLGIFQILFEWISEGRNIYIIGDGNNLFQFAHIDDLVDVSVETALKTKNGIFNVGTDKFGTLRECLEHLCEFAGTGSKVRSIPVKLTMATLWLADKLNLSPLGPWHYMTYHKPYYFDLSKPMNELTWRPKYSNDEMLVESYKWYLQNKSKLESDRTKGKSAHRGTLKQGVIGLLKKLS